MAQTGGRSSRSFPNNFFFPVERVKNGEFSSDTSFWIPDVNCSLLSVAGGRVGNCVELTALGAGLQNFYQDVLALVVGRMYALSGYVKSGSSGDELFLIGAYGLALGGWDFVSDVSSGVWTKWSVSFVAVEPDIRLYVRKWSGTLGTMLFDTISLIG